MAVPACWSQGLHHRVLGRTCSPSNPSVKVLSFIHFKLLLFCWRLLKKNISLHFPSFLFWHWHEKSYGMARLGFPEVIADTNLPPGKWSCGIALFLDPPRAGVLPAYHYVNLSEIHFALASLKRTLFSWVGRGTLFFIKIHVSNNKWFPFIQVNRIFPWAKVSVSKWTLSTMQSTFFILCQHCNSNNLCLIFNTVIRHKWSCGLLSAFCFLLCGFGEELGCTYVSQEKCRGIIHFLFYNSSLFEPCSEGVFGGPL